MGDPRFSRKKFRTPSHPWEGERISAEREIAKKFGLKNKKEIWKNQYFLSSLRHQAMVLVARMRYGDAKAEMEAELLLKRLRRLGLLGEGANLDSILTLSLEDILSRRLQTQVYLKGLANTPKQARQFIVHGHIAIRGRRITIPGYMVTIDDEPHITYALKSPLRDELHPMRPQIPQSRREMILEKREAELTEGVN